MNDGLSDAERDLLRKSVRDFLSAHWPARTAVERSEDTSAVETLWRGLAAQGLTSLGADPDTGLREIVLVFEELGRASCPAPLLGAVAANLALAGRESNTAHPLLDDLQRGDAAVSTIFGASDGDPAAGRLDIRQDIVSGITAFVEGAQTATHFLVFADDAVALVSRNAHGVTVKPTPGLAVPALAEVIFENTPSTTFDVPSSKLSEIALVARLSCAGRALGAAQRGFELAVDNAKVRKQFGQLIGQFQAVQHKLANCLTNLDGARLTIEAAAEAYDAGNQEWTVCASSALAFAGPALRDVSIQSHRALGAIGYAEEHEAPRHFRRVHADLARFGGVTRARAELADYMLGPAT